MPIMDNRGTVNEFNGGYDIIDLTAVDESLGTLSDFRALADSCHANGLRIILDITPNHVSSEHPWLADIRRWKDESIYRDFVETRVLGGDRGLGQSVTSEGGYPLYAHYSNWALPNLNLSTRGTREAMLDVFRFWVRDMKADGYRMDVYWGPQNRYGAATWWRPFREELKRVKPDMLVLGETDGTGSGSEVNYAERDGAMDAGYDWNWFGQIKTTIGNGDIAGLNNRTTNYSPNLNYTHYTGPYAHYLRFLENHDEDRIARVVNGNLERTKPAAAVLLTAPGMPMIYAGQEVGWQGRRDKINFSQPAGAQILPWYQTLIGLRNRFPQLRTPRMKQLANTASGVYTYLRPGHDANIVCAANFSASAPGVTATIAEQDLDLSSPLDSTRVYFFNDLLDSVAFPVTKFGLADFRFPLAAWQSRVFLLADTAMFPLATAVEDAGALPERLDIGSIYPNPFRSAAEVPLSVTFTVPDRSATLRVTLALVDGLGRVAGILVDDARAPGIYTVSASVPPVGLLSSGTYFLRLLARDPRTGASEQALRPLAVLR
jgi:glycosidase